MKTFSDRARVFLLYALGYVLLIDTLLELWRPGVLRHMLPLFTLWILFAFLAFFFAPKTPRPVSVGYIFFFSLSVGAILSMFFGFWFALLAAAVTALTSLLFYYD